MNFDSIKNKGFLWNLMYENGTFNKLQPDMLEGVKQEFEKIIQETNLNSNIDITRKNKQALIKMTQRIIEMTTVSEPITSHDREMQRKTQIENNLKLQQENFNNLMHVNKPKVPDFSDELDRPIGDDMENLVSDAKLKRSFEYLFALLLVSTGIYLILN